MLSQGKETKEELKQVFQLLALFTGGLTVPGMVLEDTSPEINSLRCSEAELVWFCFKPQTDTQTTRQGQTPYSLIGRQPLPGTRWEVVLAVHPRSIGDLDEKGTCYRWPPLCPLAASKADPSYPRGQSFGTEK